MALGKSYPNFDKLVFEMTVPELAKHYGKSERQIRTMATKCGLSCKKMKKHECRDEKRMGRGVEAIKFNEENVEYFRTHTFTENIKHFKVSQATISRWQERHGVSYKKVRGQGEL